MTGNWVCMVVAHEIARTHTHTHARTHTRAFSCICFYVCMYSAPHKGNHRGNRSSPPPTEVEAHSQYTKCMYTCLHYTVNRE